MASEVFALTDEQIVGLTPEDGDPRSAASDQEGTEPHRSRGEAVARDANQVPGSADSPRTDAKSAQAGVPVPQQAPQWLAERMQDPWCGEQASEFWEDTQNARREAAAYREVFATPEDARTLKEVYPGGIGEAKTAAERARALDEIDAAFYHGDAAARTQLAQRMMAQDPAAFRQMVEAGLRLLGRVDTGQRSEATSDPQSAIRDHAETKSTQAGTPVPDEVLRAYGEFERSANAELENTVGSAITRAMEQALPNLRAMKAQGAQRDGEVAPLQERLAAAVREEVEAGLKSDRQLGEQVARLLAGKRFDAQARAQVVRLIDARAQQLVPSAVRRVVTSWTQTTLAAHGKDTSARRENPEPAPRAAAASAKTEAKTAPRAPIRPRRFDYGRLTDEQIVGL